MATCIKCGGGNLRPTGKCRVCHAAYMRDWYQKNPRVKTEAKRKYYRKSGGVSNRKRHLFKAYGITLAEYATLVFEHSNLCSICAKPETKQFKGKVLPLSVDHDHATGKVRGLLCDACNGALGRMQDNPALLRSAAAYLEFYQGKVPCLTVVNLKG